MACLKYLTLVIFLRYFDHSNDSSCEYGFIYPKPCGNRQISTWILCDTGCIYMVSKVMACLKSLTLVVSLRYFDHSNMILCLSMDSFSRKVADIHMDFALYWLDMAGIVMACLKYLSLDIFLKNFDHSKIIPCVSMDPFSKNHVESC